MNSTTQELSVGTPHHTGTVAPSGASLPSYTLSTLLYFLEVDISPHQYIEVLSSTWSSSCLRSLEERPASENRRILPVLEPTRSGGCAPMAIGTHPVDTAVNKTATATRTNATTARMPYNEAQRYNGISCQNTSHKPISNQHRCCISL